MSDQIDYFMASAWLHCLYHLLYPLRFDLVRELVIKSTISRVHGVGLASFVRTHLLSLRFDLVRGIF
jgi:hypothetical protein